MIVSVTPSHSFAVALRRVAEAPRLADVLSAASYRLAVRMANTFDLLHRSGTTLPAMQGWMPCMAGVSLAS
jgi:hypothetical protein